MSWWHIWLWNIRHWEWKYSPLWYWWSREKKFDLTFRFVKDEGMWIGYCVELGQPGQGETIEEARESALNLVLLNLEVRKEIEDEDNDTERSG